MGTGCRSSIVVPILNSTVSFVLQTIRKQLPRKTRRKLFEDVAVAGLLGACDECTSHGTAWYMHICAMVEA